MLNINSVVLIFSTIISIIFIILVYKKKIKISKTKNMKKNSNDICSKYVYYEYFNKRNSVKTLEGIEEQGKIYKFIRYNEFEKKSTEIPIEANKIIKPEYYIETRCGNKIPLKEDKEILKIFKR